MKKINFFVVLAVLALTFSSCSNDSSPAANDDQLAYDAADGVKGARLYDHVLNQKGISDTKMTDKPNFFRCKSCHGWDLLGQSGVLIGHKPSESYPNAMDGSLMEVRQNDEIRDIFDAIKNSGGRSTSSGVYTDQMPEFGQILSDEDIWDLVKFIKETAHDVNDFYTMNTTGTYPNGSKSFSNIGKNGNAAKGLATYNTVCASCHGSDGTKINIYCQGEYLGDMFRNDPHEIQHKAVWGMPIDAEHIAAGCSDAGMMPAQNITDDDIRNLMVMGQDASAFPGFND